MSGTADGGDGDGQAARENVVSRRGVLRTTAMGVGGALVAGRAVGGVDAETVGAASSQETLSRLRWERTYRGEDSDHAFWDGCETPAGSAVLAGVTSRSQQSVVPWAVKIDADGNEVWNRTYPTDGATAGYLSGAVPAHDGGTVFIESWLHGPGLSETEDSDAVVRKIDADGEQQWQESHGGTDRDWAYGGVALEDSGYLLYGYTESYTDAEKHDIWARKVDNSGAKVWDRTVGSDPAFFANDAVETTDGGAVLAGGRWYESSSETNQLVVKLDSNGTEEWRRTYGSDRLDSSISALVRTREGYAFAGIDGADGVLYGLDTAGRELWRVTLESRAAPSSLYAVADGGFLVGGQRAVDDSARRWLVRVTDQHDVDWQETYDEGEINTLTAVGDRTLATGSTASAGWAGAVDTSVESTDTGGRSAESTPTDGDGNESTTDDGGDVSTTDSPDESSTDENTGASGPGFGPLAALSGIGIGAYRLFVASNDEQPDRRY